MTVKKRAISASLAVVILLQVATPALASDLFDGYETGATPKSWTDGGGGKYYYGGDISYRFKRNTSFKPIFESRMPGMKAGCSGLSVSGGFLHLLGLDEIKTQLQSAGQGAMMGVVVGIVYSLPGIGDAFAKVHQFVRTLQQLLSNSCQMASQATKNFIDAQRKAAGNDIDKLGYENTIGEMFNGLHSTTGGWIAALNGGADALTGELKKLQSNKDAAKKSPGIEAVSICSNVCEVASRQNMPAIKTYVQTNAASEKVYVQTNLSELSKIVPDEEKKKALEFAVIFLGYSGLDVFPQDKTEDESAAKIANILTTGGQVGTKPIFQRGLAFSADNVKGDQLAKILLYGTDSKVINVPNIKLFPFYTETIDGSDVIDTKYGVLFGVKDTASDSSYQYVWKGFVSEGADYLREVVINGNSTAKPTVPSVFPGMSRYISVLKTQYRRGNNEAYVTSLIHLLAKKNAVMLLQGVVFEMQSTLSETKDEKARADYQISIDAIYKELERMNASDAGIADTISIFEKIEREQTLDVTSGVRR